MPQDVQRIRETLKQIRGKSVTGARSMIGPYYTDPDYLQLEEEIIFGREWVCIGHLGELPETNSFFTTQVAKEPLLITRTETGVRVLSNVCRHRGNQYADPVHQPGRSLLMPDRQPCLSCPS